LINFTGAGTLRVGGNFGTGATITPGAGTLMLDGAGTQTLATYATYPILSISKTAGSVTTSAAITATGLAFAANNTANLTAGGNVTVPSLDFAAGNTGLAAMGANTLIVTGSCSTSVLRSGGGHVTGNLRLAFPAGGSCTYPIGDATNYTPVTVALTGGSAGTLTGSVTAGTPANLSISPLSNTKYVARSFALGAAADTATATTYNATLNWVAGDIQGGASFANFNVAQYRNGWVVPSPSFSGNTATSIVAQNMTTGFTTASVFAVGEVFACSPSTGAPAGVICQCDRFGRSTLNPSTIFNGNWLLSTSSGSFGIPKITNQGYLRLTDNTGNNSSAATVPGIFPAAGNWVSVEFQNFAYNGSGADGIAVTLSDYSIAPTPGAFGGSLGYAQKTGINGFAGGWIGVALDEYGNYENNTEGRVGTAGGTGLYPDSIGVRGSGSGTTGYNWLRGALNIGNIDNAGSATPANGYMYQVIVDARTYTTGTKQAFVSVNRDTSGTGNTYAPVVAPFDAYVINPAQAAVPVNWQISFTGSTGGATNIHEIGNLKVCAQTFLPPTASTTAAGFNAIDSALPNTKQNALFGHIYMKVANLPFTLNVAALLPAVGGVSQGVNSVYASSGGNKTVTVRLYDDSQAGTSCNSTPAACTACAKPVVATQTITFSGADGGFKTSPAFTVNGAYKRLIAQMNDGTTTGCSTDAFSVRPATYALTTSVAAPTKAGAQFTITATPKDAGNNTIAGTPGAPLLDNTKAPAAGGNQTLLQQSWSTGASFGAFIYNDVGLFSLVANAIYDPQFGNAAGEAQDKTNGDCNPGSGSPYAPNVCYGYSGATCNAPVTAGPADSSGKYGCDVGSQAFALTSPARFYPDHYEASLASTQACAADGFSYMGQPFSMTSATPGAMQIKALAAGQTFATAPGLPSYTGTYTPRANVWFGAQNGVGSTTDLIRCISSTQNATANRCLATTLPYKTATSNAWSLGSFTVIPQTYYFDPPKDATTTPDSTWGPYDSLSVGVTVADADGSTLTIPAGQSFVLNGDTYQSVNGSLPMKMRYGRMRIQNASGSEQVPIVVPVWLEYWSGSAWMPNLLDTSCTRLLGPPPTAYAGNTATAACYGGTPAPPPTQCTSTTAGGVGSIYTTQLSNVPANSGVPTYSAPTFSYGQRNVVLAAPKATGTLGVSVQAPAWLKIGPTNTTGANPSATVRYSSYNSRFIFLRENY
jgi:MSHA biogenesis protein MshQ